MVTPLPEDSSPMATAPTAVPVSPFAHDGTERRIVRPQDPAEQKESYSGKKKTTRSKMSCWSMPSLRSSFSVTPMAAVSMICASLRRHPIHSRPGADCYRISASWPSHFLSRDLDADEETRGQELTREQHMANQALHHRRLRIEHVNSSVKRCRIVKDRIRLCKEGVRDLVMELCCALHNFRVRLTPWQAMI